MIEMKYLLQDGTKAEEGTVEVTCEKCGRKFAVPVGHNLTAGNICEECEKAAATAELKTETPDEIKQALGE